MFISKLFYAYRIKVNRWTKKGVKARQGGGRNLRFKIQLLNYIKKEFKNKDKK